MWLQAVTEVSGPEVPGRQTGAGFSLSRAALLMMFPSGKLCRRSQRRDRAIAFCCEKHRRDGMLLPAIAATISHTKAGSLWQVLQLHPEKKAL